MNKENIYLKVQAFLIDEFGLQENLSGSDVLFSSGMLDSMDVLSLLIFFDKEFGVSFSPFEVGLEQLDTVEMIAAEIAGKK
ncbi:MAG: acyl carrier protein [Chromatiales bacterium]|nr:acyl carrier protein [Gammaproteobacteria bacterium]